MIEALAFDPAAHPDDQRHQALTYADEKGWLRFLSVTGGKPTQQRYAIVAGGVRRELPPQAVLPYVTGCADARGAGHVIPTERTGP